MYIVLAIGIPLFLLFGGGLLALAFASPLESQPARDDVERPEERTQPPLMFFLPNYLQDQPRRLTADELFAAVEDHLRRESRAVEPFVREPSASNLWREEQLN